MANQPTLYEEVHIPDTNSEGGDGYLAFSEGHNPSDTEMSEEEDVYFSEENHRIRGESEQESPYSWFEKQAAQLALAGEQLASLELAKGLPTTAESRLGFPIEWNRQFQTLIELPENTKEQMLEKNRKIANLSKDFVSMARRFGKLIVSEAFLPAQYQTINPVNVGGRAGGIKYIYNGILFKLLQDKYEIYGRSDFHAMKTGSLELKGLMRYYGIPGLHVPLMAVIDYRGFRVVAESILPIKSGAATIVYGSSDGGKTIYDGTGHPDVQETMKLAATRLNLCGHFASGHDRSKARFLYGPIDIEAHRGTDGRLYVIDCARVFPPTAEKGVKSTFLYKVMRPELVRRYKEPLSSDAYSSFVRTMADEEENNYKVLEATEFLLADVISDFAAWFDNHFLSTKDAIPLSSLTELIHREGINCRYLGLIRHRVEVDDLKKMILNEMVARACKNQLGHDLRITMNMYDTLEEHAFTDVVLSLFNTILGHHTNSAQFWTFGIRALIEAAFGVGALEDIPVGTSLRDRLDVYSLFKRIQQLTGVKLTGQAMRELKENPDSFYLVSPDIEKMSVRVKHMNITSLAEGNALAIEAINQLEEAIRLSPGAPTQHHERLFRLAMSKFEQAIRSTPDNVTMLNHYADVLKRLALMKAGAGQEAFIYFERAYERYVYAKNYEGLMHLGDELRELQAHWNEREKLFELANKCYYEVTNADRQHADAFYKWGDLLVKYARSTGNEYHYSRAGYMYRRAIDLRPILEFQWVAGWHNDLNDIELAVVIELMHLNNQQAFDVAGCFRKRLVTDNTVIQVAKHVGQHIKRFNLSGCNVCDDALIQIANNCHGLIDLQLNGCMNISDNAMGYVANIATLEKLGVSGCQSLSSLSFKYVVTKCQSLTHFDASFCSFNPAFILHMNHFSSNRIKYLNLSKLRLTAEAWCRAVSKMDINDLEEIVLDDCIDLTDQCISVLTTQKPPQLRAISLKSCVALSDAAILSIAQNCPLVDTLNFSGCINITGRGLKYLGTFYTELKSLDFTNCSSIFEGEKNGFAFLLENNGGALRHIRLGHTATDDYVTEQIGSHCKKVVSLDLSNTQVSADGLRFLSKACEGMEKAVFDDCIFMEDSIVEQLAYTSRHTLLELSLAGCFGLSNLALIAIGQNCHALQKLNIARLSEIDDQALQFVANGCPNIQELNVSECKLLTDAAIGSVGQLHSLRILDASRCLLIARVGALGVGCPELEELILDHCENLSDDGLDKIVELKSLRVLNIIGCRYVTAYLLNFIQKERFCPSLEILYLGRNKMVDSSLQALVESRPKLRVEVNSRALASPAQNHHSSLSSSDGPGPRRLQFSDSGNGEEKPLTPEMARALPSKTLSTATRALMHDLKEIRRNPLPYVSAQPLEDNILEWHGNLLGPENTPYAGAVFHIQLMFPETYPTTPPSATISTDLPHPHVRGNKICLDLLSDFQSYFSGSDSTRTEGIKGWSSAYSVQTILLQLQTFLMELKPDEESQPLHQYLSKIPAAIKSSREFTCKVCGHTSSEPWPPLGGDEPTETPKTEAEVIREELKCFHTRVPFESDVIGIGISIKYHKTRNLAIEEIFSPLDLLSYTAFQEGVREAVYSLNDKQEKEKFSHWMPLYINREHGQRASELMKTSLSLICTNSLDKFKPEMAFAVLPKLMNTMVVSVMSGRVHASIKALEGYCAAQRLMIHFVTEFPALLESAERLVSNFMKSPELRTKKYVPSLGEFLALLSVTNLQWKDIARSYLEENFIRNVRWVLQKYPELAEQSADPAVDVNRSRKTLLASLTSVRLLLFQVYFLENIGRPSGKHISEVAETYDKIFGRPSNKMKDQFLQSVKTILKIDTWEEVFKWIGLDCPAPAQLNDIMRNSVIMSLKRGYHSGSGIAQKSIRSPASDRSPRSGGGGGGNRSALSQSSGSIPEDSRVPKPKKQASLPQIGGPPSMVCKYWVESGGKHCPFGDSCRYLHRFDTGRNAGRGGGRGKFGK